MKTPVLAALMSATAIVLPTYAAAQAQDDCDRLMVLVEQDRGAAGIVAVEEARRLQAERNQEACLVALQRVEGQAGQQQDGANIVVRQPSPNVTVDPAAPQVTVQQAQPSVTVRQPQPEILVRQPAPRVTIDIPQPEIIVRMPQPEVAVQQLQPQVQVQQAQPQVQVVQPEQPQVQIAEREQAQVRLAPAAGEANVQVEQIGEPRVTYERAEPTVMVNQAEGQPNVRIEAMQGQPEQAAAERPMAGEQLASQEPRQDQAMNIPDGQMTVRDLEGREVFNARGEQIGEVENIVRSVVDNKEYAVISHGGFLGLGEKRVVLALSGMELQGDRVVLPNATDEQIRAYPAFDSYDQEFPEIEDTAPIQMTTAQR